MPQIEVVLVDMRERNMMVKDQEILTADRVAVRVSLLARYRVVDPKAAMHEVADYKSQLYLDVQLAARRALASMSLDDILMNRIKINDDIRADARDAAESYGVEVKRADVKDLSIPGSIQPSMHDALLAERLAEAHIIAGTLAEIERLQAQIQAQSQRRRAEADAEAQRSRARAELAALQSTKQAALYGSHPALLGLGALETLRELSALAAERPFGNGKTDEGT
jgi:regulator of protease activity HflC (stomatin/prohibitin superfamily)